MSMDGTTEQLNDEECDEDGQRGDGQRQRGLETQHVSNPGMFSFFLFLFLFY